MKSTAVTLLILAALILGYDYYLAPPDERLVFHRPAQTQPATDNAADHSDPVPQARREMTFNSQPDSPQQGSMPAQSKLAESKAKETAPSFHPPKIDPIEVVTGNWTTFPRSAFPRKVKLLEDAKFTLSIGSTTIRAGSEVVALSFENGLLHIAQDEKSPLRKSLPLDATDLKGRLTSIYDQWKARRTDEARKEFEARQLLPKPDVANSGFSNDSSGKPERSVDGTYPLLLQQIRSGNLSEITPTNIIRWGEVTMQTIKGMPAWSIPVTFKARTMFGEMDVETIAHVQNGRVVDWIYKGSGEPVQ